MESVLVGIDVELNAGVAAGECGDWAFFAPVVEAEALALDQIAVVITSAVGTTVANKRRLAEVSTKLFRR